MFRHQGIKNKSVSLRNAFSGKTDKRGNFIGKKVKKKKITWNSLTFLLKQSSLTCMFPKLLNITFFLPFKMSPHLFSFSGGKNYKVEGTYSFPEVVIIFVI